MLIYGSEKVITDWMIAKRKDTFVYAYKNGVKPIVIPDYRHVLPGEIKENKKPVQWIAQYRNSDEYVSRRLAVGGACKQMSDTNTHELVTLALNDEMKAVRRYTLGQLQNVSSDKYKRKWTPKVRDMAMSDKERTVRSDAFDVLGEWKVTAAKGDMIKSVTDSSYIVAGAALEALSRVDADTAYTIAKNLLGTHPRSALDATIWILIGKKGADEDVALYENRAPFVQGSRKLGFAASMNKYLKHVKSDASFNKLVGIYGNMIVTENMKSYRTGMGGFLFQVAGDLKTAVKSDNKEEAAAAEKRLVVVKAELVRVIAAETDAEELKDYNKMMKELE